MKQLVDRFEATTITWPPPSTSADAKSHAAAPRAAEAASGRGVSAVGGREALRREAVRDPAGSSNANMMWSPWGAPVATPGNVQESTMHDAFSRDSELSLNSPRI